MKIGVLGKKTKVGTDEVVQEILTALKALGHETVLFSSHRDIEGVDVVIVLGGDGAILHAAVPAAQKGIKIIGINFGNLGFLTEYEKDERTKVTDLIAALEAGLCRIVKRSLLEITIDKKVFYALNEVAIQRDNSLVSAAATQILTVDMNTKGGQTSIAGDGVLICTPTGSTAYSLSAGGAILVPEVPVFMMTPICAFSTRARPIVFADTEEFTIQIKKGKAIILSDGKVIAALPENGELHIKKAAFTADFPVRDETDFFARVRNKLG